MSHVIWHTWVRVVKCYVLWQEGFSVVFFRTRELWEPLLSRRWVIGVVHDQQFAQCPFLYHCFNIVQSAAIDRPSPLNQFIQTVGVSILLHMLKDLNCLSCWPSDSVCCQWELPSSYTPPPPPHVYPGCSAMLSLLPEVNHHLLGLVHIK